jgi:hypothetical protein
VTLDEFADRYPTVFHVAAPGAWPAIAEHGLLSTSALLDLYEVPPEERLELEERRRESTHTVTHAVHGSAVLRDQIPLSEAKLAACLDDMTVPEWIRLLKGRVFFWLSRQRLKDLLGAKAYRDQDHEVITFDTRKLLARHGDRVELSPINSGSTLFNAAKRGSRTFRPLGIYDVLEKRAPVELTVLHSVPDAKDLAQRVELWRGPELVEQLLSRE